MCHLDLLRRIRELFEIVTLNYVPVIAAGLVRLYRQYTMPTSSWYENREKLLVETQKAAPCRPFSPVWAIRSAECSTFSPPNRGLYKS